MTAPFVGAEPGVEPQEAQPDVNGRTLTAAWMLGGDPDTVGALVAGLPVPRRRLAADALQALDEPLDGPDVKLDEELALRLAVAFPRPPEGEEAEEAAFPFEGLSHGEVLDLRFEGERHLVTDLIEPATVGAIAGVPETNKSRLAQGTAVAIALGEGEVLGRKVEVQGPVGVCWQDDSRRNEAERIQTLSAARGLPRDLPVRWYLNEGLELPRDLGRLREQIVEHGFVLVVLDSFYNFVRLGSGLSLKDEAAADIVGALKREVCDATGCTVLIVDHAPWPTEGNKGQRRAYGSVFKSAAVRWSIYLERQGSKLYVSASGNNVRGLPRTPAVWNEETHELRLVDTAALAAADAEALEWLAGYIADRHAKDGAGVPRGEAEKSYADAHDGKGRNRARRVIDAQLELAEALAATPDDGCATGEMHVLLARGPGEVSTGVYLYPASHAPSPLAATPSARAASAPAGPLPATPSPASPLPRRGARQAARRGVAARRTQASPPSPASSTTASTPAI